MRKCVDKKIQTLVPKELQKEILNDIDQLQLSQSPKMFDNVAKLFLEKWKDQENFITYFQKEWLEHHRNSYEGVRIFTPSTNNALEASNSVIKKENTLRERLPLSKFRTTVMDMVMSWSNTYRTNSKVFQTSPTIDLPLWTDSYRWVKRNVYVMAVEGVNCKLYTISHTTNPPIQIPEYFNNFEEFKTKHFESYQLQIPNEKWEDGICDCKDFMKKFICHHLVGMAIRLRLVKAPCEAKNLPIGAKRKPGRPSKAKKALIVM